MRTIDAGGGAHPRAGDPAGSFGDRRRAPLPTRVADLPTLPPAFDDALDAGLGALGLELDAAARTAIEDHVRLLLAWNVAINLTAIEDPADVATLHVVDSLAAVPLLRALGAAEGDLLDLGSGGGFPGLPIVAALPGIRALLLDSVAKKARFLEAAAEATGLGERVRAGDARAEALAADPDHRGRWDLVTARAVGSLAELAELALPLLRIGGRLVAWKRGDLAAELAAATRASAAIGGAVPQVRGPLLAGRLAGHRLVVVTKLRTTTAEWPRDPATRRRRPWG